MRKKLAFLLCTLVVALFVWQPELITRGTDMSFMQLWVKGDVLTYEGFLTIWHVPSKASGTGSGDSFLSSAADSFQKENFGVFFNIESMTAEELQQKLASGERPDLISFNGGDISDPTGLFMPLEDVEPLLPGYRSAGYFGDDNYACPYMRGGSAIIVMDDAFYEKGLTPPAGPEYIDAQWLADISADMPDALSADESDTTHIMPLVLADTRMEPEGVNALAAARPAAPRALVDADGPRIMAGGLDTIYKLESTGRDAIYSVYPLYGYTSRMQYMGVCVTDDEKKQKAATAFTGYLLGTKRQKTLDGVWALPVTDVGDHMPDNINVSPFWHNDGDGDIYLLGAFDTEKEAVFTQLHQQAVAGGNAAPLLDWVQANCTVKDY